MNINDFKQISLNNIGGSPSSVKAAILGVIFAGTVGLGFVALWQPEISNYNTAQEKEVALKADFMVKKTQAINIAGYRKQMVDIEAAFGALLRQLPSKTQMDDLLKDINKSGLKAGLAFDLFKPGIETAAEFYVERPIEIKLSGNYHQLGGFSQNIANLSRIVTLNDISIKSEPKKEAAQGAMKTKPETGGLTITLKAKTFRYMDEAESAAALKAEKDAVKDKAGKGRKNKSDKGAKK